MSLLNEQPQERSFDSVHSFGWKSKTSRSFPYTSGLKGIQSFLKNRKRKRASLSPSPPVLSRTATSEPITNTTTNIALSPIASRVSRRRASTRSRELLPPQDFTSSELEKRLVLPRCCCISQQEPEPGFRVSTKARSAKKCCTTTLPQYSAKHNSPLILQKPTIIYFEAQIRSGNDDGEVGLALGFVAGRARASHLPGSEKGTMCVQCWDGEFYLNGKVLDGLATREFVSFERVGIGMLFSRRNEDAPVRIASSSAIDVELFLTRDGKKTKSLMLRELTDQCGSPLFEGFEGAHDLYPAVETTGKVSADILFEREHWKYTLEAG